MWVKFATRWRVVRSDLVRLVIARCQVDYAGRLTAHLPMATRLLIVKADGSVLVHSDGGSYKPLNWMSPPCNLVEGTDADGTRVRYHKFVHFFLLRYLAGDVADHDHEVCEARWVAISHAAALLDFASERRVVEQAAKQLALP